MGPAKDKLTQGKHENDIFNALISPELIGDLLDSQLSSSLNSFPYRKPMILYIILCDWISP